MKIAFLDNYDSFTYNLVHYLRELGVELTVIEQGDLPLNEAQREEFDAFVVGPGPNAPQDAGALMEEMDALINKSKPMLGVCLGHQSLGILLGMKLQVAAAPMHGKVSILKHTNEDVFNGLENPMQVGRYHSLVVSALEWSAHPIEVFMRDELGQIMAFRHEILPFWGVQFHPESVLTPSGQALLKNWLQLVSEYLGVPI